jgi:hypothetical protein
MFDSMIGKFVLVGFGPYGLRVGTLEDVSDDGAMIALTNCRSIFRFEIQPASAGCQGVDALCVVGPAPGSRIGPVVTGRTVVREVKRVSECSDVAHDAFCGATWAR